MRRLASGALAMIIAALLTVAVATPANAGIVDPNGPRPINVLPSVIKGTLPVAASAQSNYLSVLLYRFAKSPAFWNAVAAQQAGTATSTQIATVASETATHRVPATRLTMLSRVVGGVGVAVAGYEIGTMIGGPAGNALAVAMYGKTAEDLICSQGDASVWLGMLTATDCTAAMEAQAETYVPNSDIEGAGQMIWEQVCHPTSGTCVTFRGTVFWVLNGSTAMTTKCFEAALGAGQTTLGGLTITPVYPKVGGGEVTAGALYYPGNSTKCANGVNGQNQTSTSATQIAGEAIRLTVAGVPGTTTVEPEVVPADPSRQIRCVLLLGGGGTTLGTWSAPFYASDGIIPSPVCPEVPLGSTFAGTEIQELVNGEVRTLSTELATPEWLAGQTLAPECSDGTCLLDLRKEGLSCFQSPESCLGWFSDPNKETLYSCHYGTHAVDLTECTVYAPSFEPEAVATGDTLGDPTTGEAISGATGSAPGSDAGAFGNPAQDPEGQRECFPTGWAIFNPVEWVMKPVGCALEWAFVPRPSEVDESLESMKLAWGASVPGTVATSLATMEFAAPSGCNGLSVDMSWASVGGANVGTFSLMPACPGDFFEGVAAASKIIGYLVFTIAGVIGLTRQIGRIFGYGGIASGGDS